MPSKWPVFKGTLLDGFMWQPWFAPPMLIEHGVPIGICVRTGRVVMFDPWKLKKKGDISSTVFWFFGDKGSGKSTSMKMLLYRLFMRQAFDEPGVLTKIRAQASDRRREGVNAGEYDPVARALNSKTIKLGGRDGQVNIIDPAFGMDELDTIEIIVYACEMTKHRMLSEDEVQQLQVAVNLMYKDMKDHASVPLLEYYLRRLNEEDTRRYYQNVDAALMASIHQKMAEGSYSDESYEKMLDTLEMNSRKEIGIDAVAKRAAAQSVADTLGRIQRADYGYIFGEGRSIYDLMRQRMVNFDWEDVPEKAKPLLEGTFWKYRSVGLNRDVSIVPHLYFSDEEGGQAASGNIMHQRYLFEQTRTSRKSHTAHFYSTQYQTDEYTAGAEGSEIRSLSAGIMRGADALFVGKTKADDREVDDLLAREGIPYHERQAIYHKFPNEGARWFMLKVPGKPGIIYQNILLENEIPLVQTDSASERMANTMPIMSMEQVAYRAKKLGMVTVGSDEDDTD